MKALLRAFHMSVCLFCAMPMKAAICRIVAVETGISTTPRHHSTMRTSSFCVAKERKKMKLQGQDNRGWSQSHEHMMDVWNISPATDPELDLIWLEDGQGSLGVGLAIYFTRSYWWT